MERDQEGMRILSHKVHNIYMGKILKSWEIWKWMQSQAVNQWIDNGQKQNDKKTIFYKAEYNWTMRTPLQNCHPSCYSCQKSRDKSYSVIPHDRGMKDGVLITANIRNPWSSCSRSLSRVTHLSVKPFQI